MKYVSHKATLGGVALAASALAVLLFVGFIDLVSLLETGRFGAETQGAARPTLPVPGQSTEANLAAVQGMLGLVTEELSFLAVAFALLILGATALALLGLCVVCLRKALFGLARPISLSIDTAITEVAGAPALSPAKPGRPSSLTHVT